MIAGGTDLLPSMKQGIFSPECLLNLCGLPDLDRIEFDEVSGLSIGALVKLGALERDSVIRERYSVIAEAAAAVGSAQLRQMGTVGGNLSLDTRCYYYNQSSFWRSARPVCIKMGGETCNAVGGGKKCFAVFSGDLAPALIALGAQVRLVSSAGERSIPLKDLYTGDGARPFGTKPGELLASVRLPTPEKGTFATYLKYRIRKSIDFPLAGVAGMLVMDKEKVCRDARVVVSAAGSRPKEVTAIGNLLRGARLEDPLIEETSRLALNAAQCVANTASTPSYRKRMVKLLVMRILNRVA